MKIELDPLEVATVRAALSYFCASMSDDLPAAAFKSLPFDPPWAHVDESIGALTEEEIPALVAKFEGE